MSDNKSKFLWFDLSKEIDAPVHKALIYVLMLLFGAISLGYFILVFINLRLTLYVWLWGQTILYPILIMDLVVNISIILISVHLLSITRTRKDGREIKTNIKSGIGTPSYVQFLWLIIILAPLAAVSVQSLAMHSRVLSLTYEVDLFLAIALTISLILLFTVGGYRSKNKEDLRFAPGTTYVDELGYKKAAEKDMQRLANSSEHILIANINGRLGEGKSSYLRMMIDSQNQDDFLYTFISLTETNETKSFSKLFSERWADTIQSRYPSLINSAKNSIIDHIFREAISGTMKVLYSVVNVARWPLKRTAITAKGDNYPDNNHAHRTVASLFGYIPRFNEKYWVVVIDEIERARFDEIYRTVETIERFRIESQWGLPIKLIFILCTDRMKFKERAESDIKNKIVSNEASELALSFFEREPKSIDVHIDLPPISPDLKQKFIISREKRWLIDKYKINIEAISHPDSDSPGDLTLYWLDDMIDTSDFEKGRLDDKKAHDLMLQYLLKESPRFINKVLEETERFLGVFTRSGRSADQIRVSDLIMLQYLKFKYPEVLRFLNDIHPDVFPDFYSGSTGSAANSFLKYFKGRKQKDNLTFRLFYKEITKKDMDEMEAGVIEDIVGLICYPVIQHINSMNKEDSDVSYEGADKANYDRTLGLPENMWETLTIATNEVQDTSVYLMTQRDELYTHDYDKLPLRIRRNSTKLLNFARNIRRFYPGDTVVSRHLAISIARSLSIKGLARRSPGSLDRDTVYQNLVYLFSHHLTNYIWRDNTNPSYIDEAFLLLKEVLTSSETMFDAKITLINSMFVYPQGSQTGSSEYDRARIALEKNHSTEIKQLITHVMDKGLDEYLPETGKSIYDYTENYMYALYQPWDGDPTNEIAIKKIRRVAAHDLSKHPKVIEQYWKIRFGAETSGVQNPELQVEIETLIEATKAAGLENKFALYMEHWVVKLKKKKEPLKAVGPDDNYPTVRTQLENLGYIL